MCDTCPDYYAALGVNNTATREEIKRAYYMLSRQVHPDKSQRTTAADTDNAVDASLDTTSIKFHELGTAWEVLSDPARRREYDKQRGTQVSMARGVVQDEVDLDDMDFDKSAGVFSFPCRCSAQYEIGEDDLEEGREIAPCSGCSLKIRVLYDTIED
ncbi:DnaJ sub C member 24 [Coemansia sp. RSA 2559]|nr:DnaJ sub C member 24 [Coemansia sp. RSA 2559]